MVEQKQYWAHKGTWPGFKGRVKALTHKSIYSPLEVVTVEDGSNNQAIFSNIFPVEYHCSANNWRDDFVSWLDENNIKKIIWRNMPVEIDGWILLTFYAILEGEVDGRCDPYELIKI